MKAKFIEMFRGVATYQIGYSWMVEVYDDFYQVNYDKVPDSIKAAALELHKDRRERIFM